MSDEERLRRLVQIDWSSTTCKPDAVNGEPYRPDPRYRIRRKRSPLGVWQWLIWRLQADGRYRLVRVRLTFADAIDEVDDLARIDLIAAVAKLGGGIPAILLREAS